MTMSDTGTHKKKYQMEVCLKKSEGGRGRRREREREKREMRESSKKLIWCMYVLIFGCRMKMCACAPSTPVPVVHCLGCLMVTWTGMQQRQQKLRCQMYVISRKRRDEETREKSGEGECGNERKGLEEREQTREHDQKTPNLAYFWSTLYRRCHGS